MKRSNSDPDFDVFQVKKCKLPENTSAMNNSSSDIPPPTGSRPRGLGSGISEADSELRRVVDNFVSVYEQLGKCNGPNVKPNYSYTELAYLAMLRSQNFCLPITEIYRYIQSRFAFFKNSTRKHWKNAVRHSLAKTLCFTKINVGRGKSSSENLSRSTYLWCIIPSSITSFARGDYRPSADKDSGSNSLRWGYYRTNAGQFWDQVGNYLATKMAAFKKDLDTSPEPGQIFESQVVQIPESVVPPQQDMMPLSTLQMVNVIPTTERQFGTILVRSGGYGLVPPPPYSQTVQNTQDTYHPSLKREVFSQQFANNKREPFREITSTPQQSRAQKFTSPKKEIMSPEAGYLRLPVNGHLSVTPVQHVFDFNDSGNGSFGLESSPGERRSFPSCQQQGCVGISVSPPLDTDLGTHAHDLSDIDITPFEIPELSDFSHIVSPQTDLLSPHSDLQSPHVDLSSPRRDLSFNDSGYPKEYSYSCRINSPRSFTDSPCRFTNTSSPFVYPAVTIPTKESTSQNSVADQRRPLSARMCESRNFSDGFLGQSDPMFGQCSGGYSAWKL